MEFEDANSVSTSSEVDYRFRGRQIANNPEVKSRLLRLKVVNTAFMSTLIIVGIVFIITASGILSHNLFTCPGLNVVYIGTWTSLLLGFGMVILGSVGFGLVVRGYNHSTFKQFTIAVCIIFIIFIVILVLSVKVNVDLTAESGSTSNSYSVTLKSHFVEAKAEYPQLKTSRAFDCWNLYQKKFNCCGATSYMDWADTPILKSQSDNTDNMTTTVTTTTSLPKAQVIPTSCLCLSSSNKNLCSAIQSNSSVIMVYTSGCSTKVQTTVASHLIAWIIITPISLIVIALMLIMATVLSLTVMNTSSVADMYALKEVPNREDYT